MTENDETFLKAVNRTLAGARLDQVRFEKYSGSLHFQSSYGPVMVAWGGWLSDHARPRTTQDDAEFLTAQVIGPFVEQELDAIRKQGDLYVLEFRDGGSVFAGKWDGDNVTDNVLLVRAESAGAPITWGLLD